MNRSISIKTKLLILIEGEENIQKKTQTHTRHIFLNATRWRFFQTLPLKAKQAKKRKASHEEAVLTHLLAPFIYKQIPVIVQRERERERKKTKKKRIVKRSRDFPVHRPGGRSTAVKSGWVNRFHLSDSQPVCAGTKQSQKAKKKHGGARTWRKKIDFPPAKCNHMCVLGGGAGGGGGRF